MVRAGKVIVLAVLVLGVLNSIGVDGSFGNEDTDNSVLSAVGKGITPVFTPMGIQEENWPATVGLFTGLFAKEAVVGTLNGLYGQMAASEAARQESSGTASDSGGAVSESTAAASGVAEEAAEAEMADESGFGLWGAVVEAFAALRDGIMGISFGIGSMVGADVIGDEETVTESLEAEASVFTLMRRTFTPVCGYAYLLFVLVYFPCLAAFGAVVKEMGIGYGALHALYLTLTAWAVAVLYYQIAEGGSVLWLAVAAAVMAGQFILFRAMGKRRAVEAVQAA
jgi:ferrous iron transport protein B